MAGRDDIAGTAKILVLDDDPTMPQAVDEMPARGGYRHIWTTDDPAEALDLYRRLQPDMVLTGLRMSPIDVVETMLRVRILLETRFRFLEMESTIRRLRGPYG
jgi:CheY-like chemotaxis protein